MTSEFGSAAQSARSWLPYRCSVPPSLAVKPILNGFWPSFPWTHCFPSWPKGNLGLPQASLCITPSGAVFSFISVLALCHVSRPTVCPSVLLLFDFGITLSCAKRSFLAAPLQVFYAMCQGLLYAFCYHLDSLLGAAQEPDPLTPSELQSIHLSGTAQPAVCTHSDSSCMQPAEMRQVLSDMLPQILFHRSVREKVSACHTNCFCMCVLWRAL